MFEKLSEKDKKTLKMGGIGAVVVIVLVFGTQGYSNWNRKKTEYNALDTKLKSLNVTDSARERLMYSVPIFQMPKDEQTQKTDFRSYLDKQFDGLGIVTSPWQETPTKTSLLAGYELLCLNSKGSCRFEQILYLLADLKTNPYLAGIEALHIECDPQNPQQATFDITLSTFTSKRGK